MPCVIGPLHANPCQRFAAEHLCQPDGHSGADRLLLVQDVVKVLPGYAEKFGNFGLRFADCRKNVFTQERAGMRRAAVGIAGHFYLLVILVEIDHIGIGVARLDAMHRAAKGYAGGGPVGIGGGPLPAPASGGSSSGEPVKVDVDVRVHVDQDGNWDAAVQRIAAETAMPIMQQGLDIYEREALPTRVREIASDRWGA